MSKIQQVVGALNDIVQSGELEQFSIDARDFLSARERGETEGTEITQMNVSVTEAAEVVNRSFRKREQSGQFTNVVSPVVVPKSSRSYAWVFMVFLLVLIGIMGSLVTSLLDSAVGIFGASNSAGLLFGLHYWLLILVFIGFSWWRNSLVMVPDGCQALITRFGRLEKIVGPGLTLLLDPWTQVSYIVNTAKEYPYNAPIRQAPTEGRVNASVDLFLQFRVENPADFIFTLGGPKGFSEKLENAISEVTRALIYEQKAEQIYDLVGESTQSLLDTLNKQFLPAVRFVNANITHAEPSSQQYRMDLAAPEMIRVAKEAYTYQYELKLRKEQDEGTLNKELASLRETLSEIRAEIAKYQAQMDTAREKEFNRANAYASQLLIEAESEAKANAALLEAQALDIRAVSSAHYPEILEYRFQQDVLEKLEAVADRLPQIVDIGAHADQHVDFMAVARQMIGFQEDALYTDADLQSIRERVNQITARIKERAVQIKQIMPEEQAQAEVIPEGGAL